MSTDANRAQSSASSRRQQLETKTPLAEGGDENADDGAIPGPDVEALRGLVNEVEEHGTAFQSVAIAAVQILEQALCYEREAADAALSLGQQEKMDAMVTTAEEAVQVLREALSRQGDKVVHLCSGGESSVPSDGQPWWFALTDALEVLEEGTGRMSSLTTAQPSGSPARQLSQLITQLLRGHHDALLVEADEWIS
ncbi:MAG: hypothetical protein R6T83_00220 [Salinibacter sp.]